MVNLLAVLMDFTKKWLNFGKPTFTIDSNQKQCTISLYRLTSSLIIVSVFPAFVETYILRQTFVFFVKLKLINLRCKTIHMHVSVVFDKD